jgi:hypothetical protein
MTLPISLETAAAGLGPDIDKRLLYREYRAGRLHAWKFGRRLFTSEGDIQDWIALCREKSYRSASTSEGDNRPAGSSWTDGEKSARASARNAAKMLMNSGKPSPTTGRAAPRGREDHKLQSA